jgi:hypothetical protein
VMRAWDLLTTSTKNDYDVVRTEEIRLTESSLRGTLNGLERKRDDLRRMEVLRGWPRVPFG